MREQANLWERQSSDLKRMLKKPNCIPHILLAIHLSLVTGCVFRYGFTWTETGLLASGLIDWRSGEYDHFRVNPPLIRLWATLPLAGLDLTDWQISKGEDPRSRVEWSAAQEMFERRGIQTITYLRIARLMCFPVVAIGFVVAFNWARELYGQAAAVGTALLWCFYPSLIGYGALISGDAQAASMGLITLYIFRHWIESPTGYRSYLLGMAIGLTVLTKTSWLILFLLLPSMWVLIRIIEFLSSRRRSPDERVSVTIGKSDRFRKEIICAFFVIVTTLFIVNLIYGFKGSFRRLDSFQFISKALAGSDPWVDIEFYGNRFQGKWLGAVPVPLPEDMIVGIDLQKWDFDRERWSYFGGEWRDHGWWYYYLFGMFAKTPLGMLLIGMVAIYVFIRTPNWRTQWRDVLILSAPVGLILFAASVEIGLNRHLRYVLPVIPPLLVLVSRAFISFQSQSRLKWLVTLGALTMIASSLHVYPYSLAYFNSLVGGPTKAQRWFNASNIGWGEDLLDLKRWHDRHPEARPLYTRYYLHTIKPGAMEIDSAGRVPSRPEAGSVAKGHFPTGWYAIDRETILQRGGAFEYLNELHPDARVGMNFLVFHVTPEVAAKLSGDD